MGMITEEATKTDKELVRLRSDPAREELRLRVEWRRRNQLRPEGLLRSGDLNLAPEETVLLLCDLGVPLALEELQRRSGLS